MTGPPNGEVDTILNPQQVKRLVETAGKTGNAAVLRRITTMNGQLAALSFPAERGNTRLGEVQAVVSNDRRRVRLTLVLDRKQAVCASG